MSLKKKKKKKGGVIMTQVEKYILVPFKRGKNHAEYLAVPNIGAFTN